MSDPPTTHAPTPDEPPLAEGDGSAVPHLLPPLEAGAFEVPIWVPRHAVGPGGRARAGEVWRAFQEAAVRASCAVGWDPARYESERCAFVVYALVARHLRPLTYGHELRARTWVRDFRRGVLSRRHVVLYDGAGVLAEATQHWVHVGPEHKPARASRALLDAFVSVDHSRPTVELSRFEAIDGRTPDASTSPDQSWAFEVWHGWMDPLAHANHPLYADWCDEALARAVAATGVDPQRIRPIEERIDWKSAACAGDTVVVKSTLVGRWAETDAAVLAHRIESPDGRVFATATTVRTIDEHGAQPIIDAFLRAR